MHPSEYQRMCSKKSSSKIKLRFVLYYIEIFIYMKTKNDTFWSVSLKLFYWAQTLKLGEVYGKYKQFCGNIIWKRWRVYVKKQLNICEIKQKYINTKICVSSYFRKIILISMIWSCFVVYEKRWNEMGARAIHRQEVYSQSIAQIATWTPIL